MRGGVHFGSASTAYHFYQGDPGHLWYVPRCNQPNAMCNPIQSPSLAANSLPSIQVAITKETLDNSWLTHSRFVFAETKHHNAYFKCDHSAPELIVTYATYGLCLYLNLSAYSSTIQSIQ
jgi:hypothetical protein